MNSFRAIAARHDTTLAVVAPGIAEALFATAMGLLAAIPAVIFYNRFVNEIGRYNAGSTPSPTNSPPSCRASSTRRRADGGALQTAALMRRTRRGRGAADVGDQRHAVRRRDAGAAHRLHGDGAAAHRRRAGRSAQDAAPALGQDREPLSVTINKGGQIYLQNTPIAEDELVPSSTAIAENGYDQRIFVRGDTAVDYGKVMEVMGLLTRQASPISGWSPMSKSQNQQK